VLRAAFAPRSGGEPLTLFGLTFRNRVGLAAGYDKDGTALQGLASIGFGHIEIGTVTPQAQPGNPPPRLFRLVEDGALINRMGFPSEGAAVVRERLVSRRPHTVVGVSLGKAAATELERAVEDYLTLLGIFRDAADYLAINISSPNTLGLRRLQARDHLERLLDALTAARRQGPGRKPPILVKLSPDLDEAELDDALGAIVKFNVEGIIAANTTTDRSGLRSDRAVEGGGLSGRPLFERTLRMTKHILHRTGGAVPVIACGGVSDREHVVSLLDAGASLVQVYTALVYAGPGIVRRLVEGSR
jgi:dihydroorotate dehydrogenase